MKTRTSKKVLSRRPPQKPFAAMSNLALSSIIAEAPLTVSPKSGCKVGSMQTSLQTSDNQPPSVPDLVVSDGGEATFGAGERMFHREMDPTGTISRSIGGKPTIPQGQSISKGAFVEGCNNCFADSKTHYSMQDAGIYSKHTDVEYSRRVIYK